MAVLGHLGDYVRARRGQVTPSEVGLVAGPRRRVAGLRRDELALLAGISSEYLQRLEQGRDRHPSAEVLDSIARALRMDAKATAYLHQLAHPTPRSHAEHVSAAIAELIDQFPMPAIVVSRYQDVLAANPIARALSPGGSLHVADYGWQRTSKMRKRFRMVQKGDGFDNTEPNALGVLPDLMTDVGFRDVEETHVFETVSGSISIYRAVRR